jgi:hypothetical protein
MAPTRTLPRGATGLHGAFPPPSQTRAVLFQEFGAAVDEGVVRIAIDAFLPAQRDAPLAVERFDELGELEAAMKFVARARLPGRLRGADEVLVRTRTVFAFTLGCQRTSLVRVDAEIVTRRHDAELLFQLTPALTHQPSLLQVSSVPRLAHGLHLLSAALAVPRRAAAFEQPFRRRHVSHHHE